MMKRYVLLLGFLQVGPATASASFALFFFSASFWQTRFIVHAWATERTCCLPFTLLRNHEMKWNPLTSGSRHCWTTSVLLILQYRVLGAETPQAVDFEFSTRYLDHRMMIRTGGSIPDVQRQLAVRSAFPGGSSPPTPCWARKDTQRGKRNLCFWLPS